MQELLKYFHELSLHPKNAKELKGLILKIAIQGKLTADWRAQNPKLISGDNSSKNLLNKIKTKKAELVKQEKLKKSTSHPISKSEIPFEIPGSWSWCRFNDIIEQIKGGGTPSKRNSDYWNGDLPWASVKDLKSFRYLESTKDFISQEGLKNSSANLIDPGSLIICTRMGLGKISINKIPVAINQDLKAITLSKLIEIEFIYDQYRTKTIIGSGMTVSGIKQQELLNVLFAIPSREEQKVIMKVIDNLFKEIEALENLTKKRIELKKDYATSALMQLAKNDFKEEWQALKPQFHTFFNELDNIKKLRETILQLGVQGKLTAKWRAKNPKLISGENSAEHLLKEIKADKAKLIKEKKIKKEKALPPIMEDEIPFELPEGWVWCRVGDILEMLSDYHANGSYKILKKHTKLLDDENYAIMLRTTNFHKKNRHNYKYITKDAYNFLEKSKLYPGDIIMNKIGDPGTVFWVDDRGKPMSLAMNLFLLRAANQGELNRILYLYLIGNVNYVKSFAAGTSTQTITKDAVKELIFPLAPLNEHYAIVENVNSLMALCEQLEKQIENGQQQIEDIMKSILKEVFDNKANKELENA